MEDNGTSLVLKKEKHQTKILYPKKMSFKNGGKIKTFSEKQKLTKFITISKPAT